MVHRTIQLAGLNDHFSHETICGMLTTLYWHQDHYIGTEQLALFCWTDSSCALPTGYVWCHYTKVKSKGAGGIRTHGGVTHDGFQDRYNNPLCHGSKIIGGLSWYRANIFQSNKVMGNFFDRCPTPQWYFLDRRPMTSQVLVRQVPYHLEYFICQTHEPSCYQPMAPVIGIEPMSPGCTSSLPLN